MKLAAIVALSITALSAKAQVDVKTLVEQSVRNYERDWRAGAANWGSTQTDVKRADGAADVEVTEVIPLDGTPYDRLLSKNGQPLSGSAEHKEDRKYERTMREREEESPSEREARIRKYESERAFVKDVPTAYAFRLLGDEVVDGRPAWVVAMTPRPDFVPTTPHAAMLSHLEGKLWIDKQDVQWAKAEATVMDTISVAWIFARIERGTKFSVEQTRVADGLWMPRHITISGTALVMMVHSKALDEELTWSGYRREDSTSVHKVNPNVNPPAGSKSFR